MFPFKHVTKHLYCFKEQLKNASLIVGFKFYNRILNQKISLIFENSDEQDELFLSPPGKYFLESENVIPLI